MLIALLRLCSARLCYKNTHRNFTVILNKQYTMTGLGAALFDVLQRMCKAATASSSAAPGLLITGPRQSGTIYYTSSSLASALLHSPATAGMGRHMIEHCMHML